MPLILSLLALKLALHFLFYVLEVSKSIYIKFTPYEDD